MAEKSNLVSLSTLAGLFKLSEVETRQLEQNGVIPKAINGGFDLVGSVRSYISHLRDSKVKDKAEVARHLDMSERNLTDVLRFLNLDYRVNTIDEIRTAYIRDMREKAAGRGGEYQEELAKARTREANISADLKELQVLEKSGQLVDVKEVEPYLIMMVTAAKNELLTLPTKLKHYIKSIHGVDLDITVIEEVLHDSLSQLSTSISEVLSKSDAEGEQGLETASEIN